MRKWFSIDVNEMFSFHRPPLDMVVRASLIYLAICVLLRVMPKRQAGKLSPNDLVVIVLIGGIATTALEMAPMSISDVLVVIITILFWSFALDWLAYRFPILRPYIQEPPTLLIQDGRILAKNLRQEMVTEEEMLAQLRIQGVHDIGDIKQAHLEADGTISVLELEGKQSPVTHPTEARLKSKKKRPKG